MSFLAPLISAIGPLFLWPVEMILPLPFLVEEIFKAGVVYLILTSENRRTQEKLLIASALLFSLSESVMYLFNISLTGNSTTFFTRLGLTGAMHLSTFLVIYLFGRRNLKLLPLGVLFGAVIHFFYNYLVAIFFAS